MGRGWRALRRWIGGAFAMVIVAASTEDVSANSTGPILGFTGAPQEPISGDGANCNYPGCHQGNDLNSPGGEFTIFFPEDGYEPGLTYAITVDLARTCEVPMCRWGFQLTVLDGLLQNVGALAPADANTKIQDTLPLRVYITHTNPAGTAAGQAAGNTWAFQWTAPEADVGPVTFYAAGNAANNDQNFTGDFIYTTSTTVPAPEPSPLAAALAALSTAAALARRKGRLRSKDGPGPTLDRRPNGRSVSRRGHPRPIRSRSARVGRGLHGPAGGVHPPRGRTSLPCGATR